MNVLNTPNKLTLLRVVLIPVYMILFLECGRVGLYLALAVFIIAALTDWLDGNIARRTRQVTTFGKLMDPLADKLLTQAAFICFLAVGTPYINAWVVMIILARELLVTGVRMLAMGEQRVIAASMLGKLKTVSQFLLIIVTLLNSIVETYREPMSGGIGNFFVLVLVIITVALTVLSGVDYVLKNKKLITFK